MCFICLFPLHEIYFLILHYSSIQGAAKIKVNSENLPYLLNANFFYTWYIWNSSHFIACRKRRLITNASFLYYQKFYISNIQKFPRIFIDVLSHNVFSYATKHLFKVNKRDNATTLCKLVNCKAFHIKTLHNFLRNFSDAVKQPNFPDAQIPAQGEQKKH